MSQDGVFKLVLLPRGEGLRVRGCAGGGSSVCCAQGEGRHVLAAQQDAFF